MSDDADKKEDEAKDEAPAEGADGAEGEGAAKPAKSGKKKLIMILAPVLVILLGAGGYFMFGGKGDKAAEEGHEATPALVEPEQFAFYDLPEILVNLNAEGGRQSFLKISISLELADPLKLAELKTMEPRIVDKFQTYLRALQVADLQGTRAVYRLREELLYRVNETVKPIVINQVLFKEILVQ